MSLHRPRPSQSGDNDGGAYSIEGDLLCGRGTPCLLLVFSLLGSTRSDLWILNFSRVLLLHVLVCVSKSCSASGKTMAPLIFLLRYILTPSEECCISIVCDSDESPTEAYYIAFLSISAVMQSFLF